MSGAEETGFLGRWSRRKRGVEAEAPTAPVAETQPGTLPDVAAEPPGLPKSGTCPIPGMEPIDISTLPPIEELSVSSDLAPFLRPGIPAALRSAALRRMWSLDPEIRDFIGCVEYQWDFNTPGGLPNGFASELVGDVKKLLAQAIGEVEEKPAPEGVTPGETPVEAILPDDTPDLPLVMAAEAPAMLPPGVTLAAPRLLPVPVAAEAAEPDAEPVPQPDGVVAPRRRHGGALPA